MQNYAPVANTVSSTEKKRSLHPYIQFFIMNILNSSLLSTQTLKKYDSLLPHNAFL